MKSSTQLFCFFVQATIIFRIPKWTNQDLHGSRRNIFVCGSHTWNCCTLWFVICCFFLLSSKIDYNSKDTKITDWYQAILFFLFVLVFHAFHVGWRKHGIFLNQIEEAMACRTMALAWGTSDIPIVFGAYLEDEPSVSQVVRITPFISHVHGPDMGLTNHSC